MPASGLEFKNNDYPIADQRFPNDHLTPQIVDYNQLDHPIFPMQIYDLPGERALYIREYSSTTLTIQSYKDMVGRDPNEVFDFPGRRHILLSRELEAIQRNRNQLGGKSI